jgi:hypothetical protein
VSKLQCHRCPTFGALRFRTRRGQTGRYIFIYIDRQSIRGSNSSSVTWSIQYKYHRFEDRSAVKARFIWKYSCTLYINCVTDFTNGIHTRLVHKVSFPGAMYRNKTQLHGNIYCNRYSKCSAFFQHIRHRNWDICTSLWNFLVSGCIKASHFACDGNLNFTGFARQVYSYLAGKDFAYILVST